MTQSTSKFKVLILCLGLVIQTACTSSFIPGSGPSNSEIIKSQSIPDNIPVLDINAQNIQGLSGGFKNAPDLGLWQKAKPNLKLGAGDVIQISMWEAPPAVLFGSAGVGSSSDSIGISGGILNLPEQIVSSQGYIVVPFVGKVRATGRSLTDIEDMIRGHLSKIANKPQVIARLVQNNHNSISIISDGRSLTLPLTPKGERLIDVLPNVVDIKKIKSTSLLVSRGGNRITVRASDLSRQDLLNFYLYPGDTVRVLQDPYTISVLGASNANTTVPFGDEGLTLAEAIAKTAGLNDYRADPKGVFVFRKNASIDEASSVQAVGQPIIYRLDLTKPDAMAMVQRFTLKDKDILYVSNASGTELQKFLSIIGSITSPVANTKAVTQ
ncbi:polysaccharide biosynthesis/export family protein [Acinetobacter brisouii]|uniref:polysaccharide biosynthesis/export family protein n=1 Tax=Acinetobacter brisouii TaxID=396323 RepID=UPI001250807F|nr:polysaccharide biosynthesis/export family protein [Acinetobacter brisouii]